MDKTAKKRLGLLGLGVSVIALVLLLQSISAQSPSVSYALVTEAGEGSPEYTPVCLYTCYLPVEFSVSQDATFDKERFSSSFKWVKGEAPAVTVLFGRHETVQKERSIWAVGCEPYEATLVNGSAALQQDCADIVQETHSVDEWVWYTEEQAHGMALKGGTNYRILLKGSKNPSDSADVVPEVAGANLTELAEWNGVHVDVTTGLSIYWDFNSTNGGADLARERCNLSVVGSVPYVNDNWNKDEALSFSKNTSNYLANTSSADCSGFPASGPFAIMWCGMHNTTGGNSDSGVLAWSPVSGQSHHYVVSNINPASGVNATFAQFQTNSSDALFSSDTREDANAHICNVFQYNGTHKQVWHNDTLKASSAMANLATGGGHFRVGRLDQVYDEFNGRIDWIGVWNRTLNASEVSYLIGNATVGYNSPLAPPAATESEGDAAIDAGIAASTATGGTNTTERQVYIRYLDGTQKLGIFDRTLSEGNQRWLFLYRTGSESFTAMDNISTALYVWERESMTNGAIAERTERFINETKG